MSTRQIIKRVAKLENLRRRPVDGIIPMTLEELCRSMWRSNKKGFVELAKNNSYQLFVYQFEQEDASGLSLSNEYCFLFVIDLWRRWKSCT